jgi:CO dehydrogenase maturation factor
MKISVCGKGGSGKSTIVALLANEALKRGCKTLVIDSDESNSGLFHTFGFDHPPVPLMEMVGGKKGLKQKMSQPNIFSETSIRTAQIPGDYSLRKDGLQLVSIGKILQSLEGCACPMGVLSREFLKKLDLAEDELAIVDMEAGVEHFGRGVETSIDSILIVIEPPLESVNVGQKIHDLASEIGIKNVWAVLNKVPTEEIADRLKAELKERYIEVVGCIYFDADVFASSMEGKIPADGVAVREVEQVMNGIFSRVKPEWSNMAVNTHSPEHSR